MKGARRVKRRTADRHPDVVLAGRLSQALHQAGLADPGLALDQHDLAAAMATAVPGAQQQPHLLLAPDEGCRTPGPGRGKPALDIPRRQDAPGRHRLGEPLQLRCPQILEVEVIAEHRAGGRADDDLVRLRQGLQTRRQVRRLADDRGFRCGSFADLVADDHRSGGDADPHRELDPGRPGDRGIQLRHRIDDVETRPHRPLGLVLMGARVAEIDEDAVAHVLGDKAVVMPDRRTAPALIRRDHIAQIFGVHRGGECGRSHQVAKHHGQLAALGLRCRGERGRRDRRGRNRRQGDRRGDRRKCRRRGVAGLEQGRADKGEPLSALVHRQALDDQLVTHILERLVVEPEFLAQPAIADALFKVQQADDESQGLRECCYDAPFSETRFPRMGGPDSRTDKHSITFRAFLQPPFATERRLLSDMDIAGPKSGGPESTCAVIRRRFPAGASPARRPLQPEATGAGMEATKCLKPSDSGHEFGDRASVQAATRVNAEQSSKRSMCRPTRKWNRGRLTRMGNFRATSAPICCTGVVAAACTQGKRTQHGKPQCVIRDDQPDAREGQAGRTGVAERLVLPLKPGNAGGGKGPQFKTTATSGEGPGDWAT